MTNADWLPIPWIYGPQYDYYQLQNRHSGMCLTVLNASTANNAPLMQYPCVGSPNNLWTWWY